MKNNFRILLIFLTFNSCGSPSMETYSIKFGFIFEPGIYTVFLPKFKSKKIVLQEFKDGSKIFAIRNFQNKILYQQTINETFSKYHYWCLFVDENANVWYYNSDYSSSKAIIMNGETNLYETKDFCTEKLSLPIEFKKELDSKSTLENCKSIKK